MAVVPSTSNALTMDCRFIHNTSIFSITLRVGPGKIGVCCHSGLAERNAEYHVNSIFYNG